MMFKRDLILGRRCADIVEENVIHLTLFRCNMIVCEIVSPDLRDAKGLECLSLFYRLCQWIERFWLTLAKTEHVLETLPVTLTAIAWYRIVLSVDHRIVNAKTSFPKC